MQRLYRAGQNDVDERMLGTCLKGAKRVLTDNSERRAGVATCPVGLQPGARVA